MWPNYIIPNNSELLVQRKLFLMFTFDNSVSFICGSFLVPSVMLTLFFMGGLINLSLIDFGEDFITFFSIGGNEIGSFETLSLIVVLLLLAKFSCFFFNSSLLSFINRTWVLICFWFIFGGCKRFTKLACMWKLSENKRRKLINWVGVLKRFVHIFSGRLQLTIWKSCSTRIGPFT